jgi:hypothetical protein
MSENRPLVGGWQTEVHRAGDCVLRSPKPQSRTVLALLRHLHNVGFNGSPRPVGDGFSSDGREQLEYVDGQTPHPRSWTDEDAWQLGDLLRRLHDAATSFIVPPDATWQPWFARALPGEPRVIGHGDLGPWNILKCTDGRMVLIDWDNAGPVAAVWDLAQLVWLNAQLHDDDVAVQAGLRSPAERAQQAAAILDGYRLGRAARGDFVDYLVEVAVRSARDEAVQANVSPDTPSPDGRGFPTLWAITWRARAAAWLLDHRAPPRGNCVVAVRHARHRATGTFDRVHRVAARNHAGLRPANRTGTKPLCVNPRILVRPRARRWEPLAEPEVAS